MSETKKEAVLLSTSMVRTGNSMLPLMMIANQLGLAGCVVIDIKILEGGTEFGDTMIVEIYGIKP